MHLEAILTKKTIIKPRYFICMFASLTPLFTLFRVRNNFFYGGNYPHFRVEDVLRNKQFLDFSLIILNECLELNNDVKSYFLKEI